MTRESVVALVANAALLSSLVYIYDLLIAARLLSGTRVRQAFTGIIVGCMGILVMLMPWTFLTGINFDTRSVLLAISGLFLGVVPTLVAVLMTAASRLIQGGAGAWTGVAVIFASGAIGVAWRHSYKNRLADLSFKSLYLLGLLVHAVMLALMFLLPLHTALAVLSKTALPVIVLYPLTTAGIGLLFVDRLQRDQKARAVRESEIEFRALTEQAAIGVTKTETATGRYVFVNQRFADIVGYTREELLSMSFHDITDPADLAEDLSNVDRLVTGITQEYSMEKRYLRKDGATVWVNLTVSPLWQPGQAPQYLVGLVEDITDRQRSAEALRESEEKFRNVFELSPLGKSITQIDGSIEVNRAFAEMLGYTKEELEKANWRNLTHPDDLQKDDDFVTALLAGSEQQLNMEKRYVHKDGSIIWAEVHASAVRNADGQPTCFVTNVQNITERKKLEEERWRLASILEESLNEIYVFDPETLVFSYANQAALHNIGYTMAELRTMTPVDIKPLLTLTSFRALLQPLVDGTRQRLSFETIHRRKDGTEYPVEVALEMVGDGPERAYLAVINDITERKKLEQEVTHLASFPAQDPNPIVEVKTDGSVLFANAAARATLERLGLPPDVRQFLPETPQELALLRSRCEQSPQTRELQVGGATFLKLISAPERDALRVYAVDVSQLKQAEEEVCTLNAELEERVRRRTAELETANRELEAFSYSVSHDLRAPLRGINGFSQAAIDDSEGALPEAARNDLERVQRSAQRMGQLIDDMLLLARVTRAEMHIQPLDMTALASDVAEETRRDNPGRAVQLDIQSGMAATGDARLLRIVYANLLSNAWKFTSRHDHAHVVVGTAEDPEHGYAFFVRDDGAGFDPRYKDKLFGAFQRLHSLEEFPGTGIGLATVDRVIRRHGGATWADGEVERGATFYFTVPDLSTPHSAKEEGL